MTRTLFRTPLLVSLLLLAAACLLPGRAASPAAARAAQGVPAPEFPPGAAWLNTEKPLSLRGLRGKIVLLDFWTYGCINCMHIIPALRELERKYANELVVIGVHSAKFLNEDETPNIRNALLRYNIEHPVVNDDKRLVWNTYGVNVWPTLVLIDPAGQVVGGVTGEGRMAEVDAAIAATVKKFKANGLLDSRPAKFALEAAKVPNTPLWYPGKVLADAASDRLFIADSNHHRIVIATLKGEVKAIAGTGKMGRKDGTFAQAMFNSPQGMTLEKGSDGSPTLYVADNENHCIRTLDLKAQTVKTLAGTGKQAAFGSKGGTGTRASLSSPWDVLLSGGRLYIAMAGTHQIWDMNLSTKRFQPYAGSGFEARTDGFFGGAAFAQPSGLATDGKVLFVADSECSAIRMVDLPKTGKMVRTLAGGDLFEFGDRDGVGLAARFQHPLGVAVRDGTLYVADTYNHKLRAIEVSTGKTTSFLGGGGPGLRDGSQPQFYEPGGISIAGDRLYVADTNNHAIRVVDLKTKTVTTLELKGLKSARGG